MKKNLIYIVMFVFVFFSGLWTDSMAIANSVSQITSQTNRRTIGHQLINRKAEITSVVIKSPYDKRWTWTAIVKNTGNVLISKNTLEVKGIQLPVCIDFDLMKKRFFLPRDLAPGQSTEFQWVLFPRCCGTNRIRVSLLDRLNSDPNKVISTKEALLPKIKLRVTRIIWERSEKRWSTTIKNYSKYYLEILVRCSHVTPPNRRDWLKNFSTRIEPYAVIPLAGRLTSYQPGDRIEVKIYGDVAPGLCPSCWHHWRDVKLN